MLEQGTQAPSPAPDLIPAQTKNLEDSHWDWYSKWGHFNPNEVMEPDLLSEIVLTGGILIVVVSLLLALYR